MIVASRINANRYYDYSVADRNGSRPTIYYIMLNFVWSRCYRLLRSITVADPTYNDATRMKVIVEGGFVKDPPLPAKKKIDFKLNQTNSIA